ncbi:hypothetical protein [Chitinimonas lacunae]|uniref:Uncharacterized protein n=1 Tax=Chitinimonas lacunae TaxID=1963018 RepID=A0ABV8MVF1_9NEIS
MTAAKSYRLSQLVRPLCAAGFFLAGVSVCHAAPAPRFDCRLEVKASQAGQPVELHWRLHNPGQQRWRVLVWNTPLEGLLNRYLRVSREGVEVEFDGPMLKRGAPTAEEYRLLRPRSSLDGRVDLKLAYDLSKPGRYRLEWTGHLHDVAGAGETVPRANGAMRAVELHCPAVEFSLR